MTAGIDWSEIRRRLAEGEAALHAAFTLDDVQIEQLMATRARQLATRSPIGRRVKSTRPVLIAGAGVERFIIELASLAGIVPFRSCVPAPGGPTELLGIVNARGELWTVFDFSRLFSHPTTDGVSAGYVLLFRHPRRRVGLRFDNVGNVCEVDSSRLKMARDGLTDVPLEVTDEATTKSLSLVRDQAIWNHPAIREAP